MYYDKDPIRSCGDKIRSMTMTKRKIQDEVHSWWSTWDESWKMSLFLGRDTLRNVFYKLSGLKVQGEPQ